MNARSSRYAFDMRSRLGDWASDRYCVTTTANVRHFSRAFPAVVASSQSIDAQQRSSLMSRSCLALLVLLAISSPALPQPEAGRKFALLVGVRDYSAGGGELDNLKYT